MRNGRLSVQEMIEARITRGCQKLVHNEWLTWRELAHLEVIRWRIRAGQLNDDLTQDRSPRRMWVTAEGTFIYPPETTAASHLDQLRDTLRASSPVEGHEP